MVLGDERHSIDQRTHDLEGDRVGIEISAESVGKRAAYLDVNDAAGVQTLAEWTRRFDLDTHDFCAVSGAFDRDRNAAQESSPSHRNDNRIDSRILLENLQSDGSRSRDNVGMRIGGDEGRRAGRGVLLRSRLGLVVIRAADQLGTQTSNRFLLRAWSRFRDVDSERQSRDSCRVRERLSVIAGGSRDQPGRLSRVTFDDRGNGIQRSANLERKGRLQCFELEEDVSTRQVR